MYSKVILLSAISLILSLSLTAQQKTNVEKLNQLSEQFSQEWAERQARVIEFAANNNLEITVEGENGRIIQMVDVVDGFPVYVSTTNLGAAITTRTNELWSGGSTGLNLSGEGYDKLGIWDGGKVRTTHQEFNDGGSSRVTQMDNTMSVADHPTHVAGTMIAGGVQSNAKGMAYEGLLKAWDWNSDLSEMATAAANGLEISNHSYSYGGGWQWDGDWTWTGNANISPTEDYRFGFYGSQAKNIDNVAYNAPNYLIAVSAGNHRGEGPSNAGQGGNPEKDGGEDGYDCLSNGYTTSKNVLTVGAVYELLNYTNPDEVSMSSFSCWGPADDGRIKPDIVAKGVQVYSATGGSNNSYDSYNGTSMSSPNTSGTLALLQQHYQNLNGGTPMTAASLKALILHTADEAGPDPGPDYMFGWGLLNAQKAAQLITDDQGQNVIDELELDEGLTYEREINVPEGLSELVVTICWTDPAGTPVGAQLDPLDPMLKNDLDLTVIDENTNSFFPYKLDPLDPPAAATNDSKNAVDNVEMVYISEPATGTYTIQVDHDGPLQGNDQAFSIIISGIDEYDVIPECTSTLTSPDNNATGVSVNQWISWADATFASTYDVYFGTDGGGIDTPTNVFNGENFPTNGFTYVMEINTTYYLQVVPRNNVGTAEGCEEIWSFTTLDAINEFPYVQDIEGVSVPNIPEFWSTQNYSDIEWLSTSLTSNSGDNAMGCYNDGGLIETEMDNWFVSPPISVESGMAYPLSFYYRSFMPNHSESLSLYWGSSPEADDMNNLVWESVDFTTSGWEMAETNIFAPETGILFLGWQAKSPDGYGIFLDDITIEAGSLTGIEKPSADEVRIYSSNGYLNINANDTWSGADLSVINLMGQVVYEGTYSQPTSINLKTQKGTGLYFLTLRQEKNVITKKFVLSDD